MISFHASRRMPSRRKAQRTSSSQAAISSKSLSRCICKNRDKRAETIVRPAKGVELYVVDMMLHSFNSDEYNRQHYSSFCTYHTGVHNFRISSTARPMTYKEVVSRICKDEKKALQDDISSSGLAGVRELIHCGEEKQSAWIEDIRYDGVCKLGHGSLPAPSS